MRPDHYGSHYHFEGCCIEHYIDSDGPTLIEQAIEQAPVPAMDEVPPMQRKVNWRA